MRSSNIRLKRVRPLLGTYVEITLSGAVPEDTLNAWITAGFEAIEEIDQLMSLHKPDSDLSRLNQARPGDLVTVHPHTLKVLRASNELYRVSGGIFDIRCMTKFSPSSLHGPPTELFGGDGIIRARKTGPWTFDLGGIAKGYAVDCGVEKIKKVSSGHRSSGVVNAGGDLRRWGKDAPPVAVATSSVRTPSSRERLCPAVHVQMPDGKILTEEKTVTVFADRCLWSDALTKIMLLAPQHIADRCLKRYAAYGWVLA
jgi:thiamine biosynthesis lipoprotein